MSLSLSASLIPKIISELFNFLTTRTPSCSNSLSSKHLKLLLWTSTLKLISELIFLDCLGLNGLLTSPISIFSFVMPILIINDIHTFFKPYYYFIFT